jgi:hypothetical protein
MTEVERIIKLTAEAVATSADIEETLQFDKIPEKMTAPFASATLEAPTETAFLKKINQADFCRVNKQTILMWVASMVDLLNVITEANTKFGATTGISSKEVDKAMCQWIDYRSRNFGEHEEVTGVSYVLPEELENGSVLDANSEDNWQRVVNAKGRKPKARKTQASTRRVKIDWAQPNLESASVREYTDTDLALADFVWPEGSLKIELVYQPGVRAPFTANGERVSSKDMHKHKISDLVWQEIRPGTYIPIGTLDVASLRLIYDEGCITEQQFNVIVSVLPDERALPDMKLLTHEEAVRLYGQAACRLARTSYWAGRACQELIRGKYPGKTALVNAWNKRLAIVDGDIDTELPMKTLHGFLRSTLKEANPNPNSSFYSFKAAMGATQKVGESKTAYLERVKKSMQCYWGSQYDKFVGYWEVINAEQPEVKPAIPKLAGRLAAKMRKRADELADLATKKAISSGKVAASYAAVLKQKTEEYQEVAQGLSWRSKFYLAARICKNKARSVLFGAKSVVMGEPDELSIFEKIAASPYFPNKRWFFLNPKRKADPLVADDLVVDYSQMGTFMDGSDCRPWFRWATWPIRQPVRLSIRLLRVVASVWHHTGE